MESAEMAAWRIQTAKEIRNADAQYILILVLICVGIAQLFLIARKLH